MLPSSLQHNPAHVVPKKLYKELKWISHKMLWIFGSRHDVIIKRSIFIKYRSLIKTSATTFILIASTSWWIFSIQEYLVLWQIFNRQTFGTPKFCIDMADDDDSNDNDDNDEYGAKELKSNFPWLNKQPKS